MGVTALEIATGQNYFSAGETTTIIFFSAGTAFRNKKKRTGMSKPSELRTADYCYFTVGVAQFIVSHFAVQKEMREIYPPDPSQ